MDLIELWFILGTATIICGIFTSIKSMNESVGILTVMFSTIWSYITVLTSNVSVKWYLVVMCITIVMLVGYNVYEKYANQIILDCPYSILVVASIVWPLTLMAGIVATIIVCGICMRRHYIWQQNVKHQMIAGS